MKKVSSNAGIYILTDKKAKILTALKASMRGAEAAFPDKNSENENAATQIKGSEFAKLYDECKNIYGSSVPADVAIVLFDDYVAVLIEACDPASVEKQALEYSEVFEKPVLFTVVSDSEDADALIFGAAENGKLKTRLIYGNYCEEYELPPENINMDYMAKLFNADYLTDLNRLAENPDAADGVSDLTYALDEDYGIRANLSPISIPLYDEYKALEQNGIFCVYTVR